MEKNVENKENSLKPQLVAAVETLGSGDIEKNLENFIVETPKSNEMEKSSENKENSFQQQVVGEDAGPKEMEKVVAVVEAPKSNEVAVVENSEPTADCSSLTDEPVKPAPASSTWICYGCDSDNAKSWEERLIAMFTVNNYAELAEWFDEVDMIFSLMQYHGFYLFRANIPPMWEDDMNKNGGHWAYLIPATDKDQLYTIWNLVTKAIMADDLPYKEQVSGCVLNASKKKYKLSVWTADCENKEAIIEIGRVMKDYLGIGARLEYSSHSDVIKLGNQQNAKKRYVL